MENGKYAFPIYDYKDGKIKNFNCSINLVEEIKRMHNLFPYKNDFVIIKDKNNNLKLKPINWLQKIIYYFLNKPLLTRKN